MVGCYNCCVNGVGRFEQANWGMKRNSLGNYRDLQLWSWCMFAFWWGWRCFAKDAGRKIIADWLNCKRVVFTGTSPDLLPSIMGAIDALLEKKTSPDEPEKATPKRSFQANNFANLSPNVQKILANVADQELNKKFSCSEETITRKSFRNSNCCFSRNAINYR